MKHLSERMRRTYNPMAYSCSIVYGWATEVAQLEANNASARAIMEKFVDKVDSGLARSTETYAEMKQWMEDE